LFYDEAYQMVDLDVLDKLGVVVLSAPTTRSNGDAKARGEPGVSNLCLNGLSCFLSRFKTSFFFVYAPDRQQ
jgi:hypothetical protein